MLDFGGVMYLRRKFDTPKMGGIWWPLVYPGVFWNIDGSLLHCCISLLICLMSGEWTKIVGWKMDREWRCFYAWKRVISSQQNASLPESIFEENFLETSIALSCLSELNICKLGMGKVPSMQCSKPCSMKSWSGVLKCYLVVLLKQKVAILGSHLSMKPLYILSRRLTNSHGNS